MFGGTFLRFARQWCATSFEVDCFENSFASSFWAVTAQPTDKWTHSLWQSRLLTHWSCCVSTKFLKCLYALSYQTLPTWQSIGSLPTWIAINYRSIMFYHKVDSQLQSITIGLYWRKRVIRSITPASSKTELNWVTKGIATFWEFGQMQRSSWLPIQSWLVLQSQHISWWTVSIESN